MQQAILRPQKPWPTKVQGNSNPASVSRPGSQRNEKLYLVY